MRIRTLIQKPRQRLRKRVKSFVQLKATEIERVLLTLEKLFINSRVPLTRLHVKRGTNYAHAGLLCQHLLHRATWSEDVSSQFVLQCFQTLAHRRVEISFYSSSIIPGRLIRGNPHDVGGAQERDREQSAKRVTGVLD